MSNTSGTDSRMACSTVSNYLVPV